MTWAFIYALPAFPIEGLSNLGIQLSFTNAVDMWPQTLAIPGFIGGLFFCGLLAVADQLRDFEALPAGRLVAWGTIAGLMVGGFVRLVLGPAESPNMVLWVVGPATVLGAIAGPGSALVFGSSLRAGGWPGTRLRNRSNRRCHVPRYLASII